MEESLKFKRKKQSRLQRVKTQYKQEEFMKIYEGYTAQQELMKNMDEDELKEFQDELFQMKEVLRDDEATYFPLIVKGPS